MKPIEIRPQWHVKTIFSLSLFVLFVSIAFSACQKGLDQPTSDNFDALAAKEWYYGTFKKSNEWASSSEKGKKLPNWSKGIYYKVGNIEIVEFPLVKAKTSFPIEKTAELSDVERKRVANASLSRILFIKNGSKIYVREADYIPDWKYLENKGFDVSAASVHQKAGDFTGKVILKKWNGSNVNILGLRNGKITSQSKASIAIGGRSLTECGILVTEYERNCFPVYQGDQLVGESCTEWQPTGNEWFIPQDCDEPPTCDVSNADCLCQTYNICGDGDTGFEGEECNPSAIYPEQAQFDDYIQFTSTPAEHNSPISSEGNDAIHGALTWNVLVANLGGWKIQANTNFSYYHKKIFNSQTMSMQDKFDLFSFATGSGYFVGSNTFIASTYTTVSPTVNQVLDNHTAYTRGWSRVQGKVTHKAKVEIRLPFCNPLTLERTDPVDNTLTLNVK